MDADNRLVREFSVELEPGEGRTLDARIVPYGVPAEVSDFGRRPYREEWLPGCFDDQLVAGHRLKVLLNFEHHEGITNVIGKGVELRSEPDGLHGSFEVLDTPAGDTALALVTSGILDGVSLEAYPKKSVRSAAGVVQRVKAHLDTVALCRRPAFADARVLAVRQEPEVVFDEELLPTEMDPEIVERCRRLGLPLPQRYEAHPENEHPDTVGTLENGTRQTVPTNLEVPEWEQHRASSGSPG
jgi:HK97 family phage prohead protease